NPSEHLAGLAAQRGWRTARLAPAGSAGAVEMARTAAAFTSMAAAFGLGAGLGLLNRSRRQAANVSFGVGSDLALALAGVQVRVAGEYRLWAHRPAVFIFSHQSWLDGLVIMKLLRRDITGVAKKE